MKDNKLIAEFMKARNRKIKGFDIENLKYHSSWDWLMPCIKKIKDTWEISDIGGGDNLYYEIYNCLDTLDIEQTYKAVIEFIKWFNKNKG